MDNALVAQRRRHKRRVQEALMPAWKRRGLETDRANMAKFLNVKMTNFRELNLLEGKGKRCHCCRPARYYTRIWDRNPETKGTYEFFDCPGHAIARRKAYVMGDDYLIGFGGEEMAQLKTATITIDRRMDDD